MWTACSQCTSVSESITCFPSAVCSGVSGKETAPPPRSKPPFSWPFIPQACHPSQGLDGRLHHSSISSLRPELQEHTRSSPFRPYPPRGVENRLFEGWEEDRDGGCRVVKNWLHMLPAQTRSTSIRDVLEVFSNFLALSTPLRKLFRHCFPNCPHDIAIAHICCVSVHRLLASAPFEVLGV